MIKLLLFFPWVSINLLRNRWQITHLKITLLQVEFALITQN